MFPDHIDRIEFFNHQIANGDLELAHCGFESCTPGFVSTPHMRDCFLIHYIIGGHGYFHQNNQKFQLGPGQIFTIFPGRIISYYAPDPDDPWIFCWFGFRGPLSMELLANAGISLEKPICPLHYADDFLTTLKICIESMQSNLLISNTLLKSHLFKLFYFIESSFKNPAKQPVRNGRVAQQFKNAMAFIEYNYHKSITVKDLTDYLNIDRTYCWKIFQQFTGDSPQQYIMKYRIEKAVELMQNSSLSMSEIAVSVGIPDPYYFSKLFKKLMGTSFKKRRALPQ